MKAAIEAEATVMATAKAAAKARARAYRQTWHPQRALPPGAVMPGRLAAQEGPELAIPAHGLTAQVTTRAAMLLVGYDG